MKKEDLRKNLINIRLNIKSYESKSVKIQSNAIKEIDKKAQSKKLNILSYYAKNPEVLTKNLNNYFKEKNHQLFLPTCKEEQLIPILVLDEAVDLEESSFKIMEPKLSLIDNPNRLISPEKIDIIIIPGVGFDRNGNRLGYGKGYYDRFLPLCKKALKIGLCFSEQLIDEIQTEPHDQKVDLIITDNERVLIKAL